MCGIAGVFLKSGSISKAFLSSMGKAMEHRGPDGTGIYRKNAFGFIHKRLSILDVDGGKQPISDAKDRVHIIANGEIYNYKQLNADLKAKSKTQSDTEAALHAYLEWGNGFTQHLHGMYAIAIFDERNNTLHLARDPFGIKPLYISETTKGIAFASEPSVLTRSGWIKAEVEYEVLPAFFSRQYVGGSKTLFKGIERVNPGEILTIKDGEIVGRQTHLPKLEKAKEVEEPLQKLDALLKEAIHSHLQSDVPYGAFLSGGIDSSTMVTAMVEHEKEPVKTYTIGFTSDTVSDERNTAELLADKCGTAHKSITFDEKDFWNYLPKMCEAMDDLVADYAALPLLKLSEHAAKDVKVILSGEGGDEIFAGYGRYRQKWWHSMLGRPFRGSGDASEFEDLFKFPISFCEEADVPEGLTDIQQRQWMDIQDWLPDDLLLKVDRCLMRHSIEGRVPYLDDTLATFGFSLPDKYKVRGKNGKWLLKSCLRSKHDFMDVFATKKGFTVPVHDWLCKNQKKIHKLLLKNKGLSYIVHKKELDTFFDSPMTKKQAKLCFSLLCYAHWHNKHIEK
jgi:asparagine synthase (glutamine-hydrolysing)